MGGGVAAARVVLADRLRRHQRRARQRIDEARLADAGAAEQRGRLPGREACGQRVQALAGDGRHHVHGHADRDGLDLGLARAGVGAQVGLGQHDDGRGAALPGGGEVALDAAGVEVGIQRGDQEGHVDIGGDHLRGVAAAHGLAQEGAAARQQMVDGGAAFRGADRGRHPVAGDRIGAGFGFMGEAPRKLGGRFAHRGGEHIEAALLHDHARGRRGRARREVWNCCWSVSLQP